MIRKLNLIISDTTPLVDLMVEGKKIKQIPAKMFLIAQESQKCQSKI